MQTLAKPQSFLAVIQSAISTPRLAAADKQRLDKQRQRAAMREQARKGRFDVVSLLTKPHKAALSAPSPTTLARPVAVKARFSDAELINEVAKLFGIGRSRFHESRFAKM